MTVHSRPAHEGEAIEQSTISLAHFFHTLRRYERVIGLAFLIVALGYALLALAILILSPTQTATYVPFRLEFEGAERGFYPNGLKFSTDEIIAEPNLLRVYNANHLQRFLPFRDFIPGNAIPWHRIEPVI